MLNPELQKSEVRENIDDQATETDEAIAGENPRLELADNNEGDIQVNDKELTKENLETKTTNNDEANNENSETKDEPRQDVRRSKRKRNQRLDIRPDEIGDCDDENDEDYK